MGSLDRRVAGVVFASALVAGCTVEENPAWIGGGGSDAGSSTGSGDGSGSSDATGTATSTTASTSTTDSGSSGTSGSSGSASASGSSGGSGGGTVDCRTLWHEPGWSLEEPVELAALNLDDFEGDPSITSDGLTLYFSSIRAGGMGGADIYVTTRPDLDSPFAGVVAETWVNTGGGDLTYSLTADLLTVYVSAQAMGNVDLWESSRATDSDPFDPLVPIDVLNTNSEEYDAFTTGEGLRLYFSRPVGQSAGDLFVAERPDLASPFGTEVVISVSSAPDYDDSPTLTDDELVLLFSSDRPGGLGDHDLYVSTRPSTDMMWSDPIALPVVNTANRDGEPNVSADGCELFFASDRPGGPGGWDLYVTRIVAP